jgi:hypothetical protein
VAQVTSLLPLTQRTDPVDPVKPIKLMVSPVFPPILIVLAPDEVPRLIVWAVEAVFPKLRVPSLPTDKYLTVAPLFVTSNISTLPEAFWATVKPTAVVEVGVMVCEEAGSVKRQSVQREEPEEEPQAGTPADTTRTEPAPPIPNLVRVVEELA